MSVVLTPLCFFIPQLLQARLLATRELGDLACTYVDDFRDKWLKRGSAEEEQLLGTSDIQSLADLGHSYSVTNEMRLVPFARQSVLRLAMLLIAPLLPLTFAEVPFEQILDHIVKLAF
jgi:hypothetical protein